MNSPTRIFFFGTPQIAVPSLEALYNDPNVEIVGVGVFPDRPIGRKQVLTPCAVKNSAQKLGIPVHELSNKSQLIDLFSTQSFDMGIVIAFGMLFPEEVLGIPALGVVNVHFSLLPKYRGASPVQSAILNGDNTSGITWQRMVKALDAGDVIQQIEYDITGKSTATLWSEMAKITAENFPQFVQYYASESLAIRPQDDTQATFCGKFSRADGEVFPDTETAQDIYKKYLAFDPWPGIFTKTKKGRMKILKCHLTPQKNTKPLNCAQNSELHLELVQMAGGKAQSATLLQP